jgi:N-formylglutamate deformylase
LDAVACKRSFDGTPVRDASVPDWPAVRADLIARFFAPYHARIEQLVADIVAEQGSCTVIDVHSYPSVAQPCELAGGLEPAARRPEVCIGTDPQHTPEALASGVEAVARALGFAIARDTPFAGTFVPSRSLGDGRVRSVMLEVRRDTYMDEASGALHDGAARVTELVRRVVERVLPET